MSIKVCDYKYGSRDETWVVPAGGQVRSLELETVTMMRRSGSGQLQQVSGDKSLEDGAGVLLTATLSSVCSQL